MSGHITWRNRAESRYRLPPQGPRRPPDGPPERHREYPPICMSAESAAKVGGAAPKDRYERELVLIRSSVRCQAKTADLLPPRTRVTGGSAGARFVLRSATTSRLRPFILARCRLPGQRSGLPGDLCSPTVSRSGPGSPLFNVWAVRLLSLSGVTPGYWPGSSSGPASCFAWQISSFLRGGSRPALASLRNVAAPALGWFSIRMVSAGRIVYWMSASWSTVSALASSSAMNTTVPCSPGPSQAGPG